MTPAMSEFFDRGASQTQPSTPSPRAIKTPRQSSQETDRVTRSCTGKTEKSQEDDMAAMGVQPAVQNGGQSPRSPKRKAAELENDSAASRPAQSAFENEVRVLRDDFNKTAIPSPPKKQKTSPKANTPDRLTPHQTPCGHENNPAHTDYKHLRCPTCRMTDAMVDVRQVQDLITNPENSR